MATNYNLDFDDDDEDETELNLTINAQKPSTWQLQDIEKLKEQTSQLLDPKWKESRNQHLIHKMLELDQPTITVKMVDYLLQDSVCEMLVGFITQNGSDRPRPAPNDTLGEEMKLAYKAVLLLSPDMITDPLNAILTKKAGAITRKLFDIFRKDSAGSFYHAYRVLECLLRLFPTETFEGLISDGLLEERMTNLTFYIGYPPVCELLVMLIALTPLPRTSPVFGACSKARWNFLEEINKWNFMLNMTKVVCDPETYCICDSYVSADQHSTAAAQLLQDLTEKLSLEDTGDLLLLPYGQNSSLIDELINCMVSSAAEAGLRRSAAKLICFLLRRAAESEIVCFVPSVQQNLPPTPNYLPNRLYALRERIVVYIRNRIEEVMHTIVTYDGPLPGSEESAGAASPLPHSSTNDVVAASKKPFGVLRQFLVEVLVLMVESDDTIASLITLDLFKALITWTLRYAHNNIYHAIFYRLIFAVLRQGQEDPQRLLFKKAKFASFLVDNFVPYMVDADQNVSISESIPKGSPNYDIRCRRVAARGLIMNCANAIRLQLSTESADTSFLINFLDNHAKWGEFLPHLTTATDLQLQFGLGIEVSQIDARPAGGGESGFMQGESKPALDGDMDMSTRFARSLGFYEEGRWSLDSPTTRGNLSEDEDVSAETLERAVTGGFKRAEKRVSMEDSGGHFSYLASEDDLLPTGDEDDSTKPPQPPADA